MSVNYFDTSATTQPLLHLWSLGIEEQFYLILPIIITILRRHAPKSKARILLASAVLSLLLFILQSDSAASFYLPHTRAWELLAGSILATTNLRPIARFTNQPWLPQVVLLGLATLFFLLAQTTSFEQFHQMYPSLFTVCIAMAFIMTSLVREPGQTATWDPLIMLGKLSFSLYLWHYPIFIILRIHASSDKVMAFSLIPIFALSIVTFKLIESPFRQLEFSKPDYVVIMGTTSAILVAFIVFFMGRSLLNLETPYDEPSQVMSDLRAPTGNGGVNLLTLKADQIANPSDKKVVIVGDSFAGALMPDASSLERYAILLSTAECSLIKVESESCQVLLLNLKDALRALRPKLVLIHFRWTDRADFTDALQAMTFAIQEVVASERIVFLGSVPTWSEVGGLPLPYRVIRNWGDLTWQGNNGYLNQLEDRARLEAQVDQTLESLATQMKVRLLLPRKQFCNESGCLAVTRYGERASSIAWDYGHLTSAGSEAIWELQIRELVLTTIDAED